MDVGKCLPSAVLSADGRIARFLEVYGDLIYFIVDLKGFKQAS